MILISSMTTDMRCAGSIILRRHLVDNPWIDLQLVKTEPGKWTLRGVMRRVLGRLGQTKLRRFSQDAMALWRGRWIDAELAAPEATELNAVVMTVAHHEGCYAAMRYAKRYHLPLITIFHDWWPDYPSAHRPLKSILERSFRQLYEESSLALCVSPRMKEKLGPHKNTKVLLPIPAEARSDRRCPESDICAPYKVLYSGNIGDYGPMLRQALETFKDHPNIRLEVRGDSAGWPEGLRKEMSERGLLLPFVSRDELDAWLESADAFLITQNFEEKDALMMQTNFPSKLTEFAKFGKPLILWGPEYASGPRWGRETGLGLVVDERDARHLKRALQELFENTEQRDRFSAAASEAATSCFSSKLIQKEFMGYLHDLVEGE